MPRDFNWDHHFDNVSFKDLRQASPFLQRMRFPTAYSPDRAWLFLSSQDDDVLLSDENQIRDALARTHASYNSALRLDQPGRAEVARVDFTTLCLCLSNVAEDTDRFDDPDEALADQNLFSANAKEIA